MGSSPAAVAINTTTGLAVVANQGSNDIELIDLTKTTPAVVGFICTGSVGIVAYADRIRNVSSGGSGECRVDNVSNLALVADAGDRTASRIVDLNLKKPRGGGSVPIQRRASGLVRPDSTPV